MNLGKGVKDYKIGGVSYSGVSQLVRRLEQERLDDKGLARELSRLEQKMSKVKLACREAWT